MQRSNEETAEFVFERLKSLGIEPNPSSRLMKMHKVITGDPVIPHGHADFEVAVEAKRDMAVMAFILEQSHAESQESGFIDKLRMVCYDSVLPQMDRQNSLGRNTQFELFVAAICQNAEFCSVGYEEPDIICAFENMRFGFAAKRIKSKGKIEKRILEASKQIQKSGCPGIIVLDTSLALNPENLRFEIAMPKDEFSRQYSEAINESLSKQEKIFECLMAHEGVVGCIVHDQQIIWDSDGEWELVGMTTSVLTASDMEEEKLFQSVWNRYRDGLPNVQHL